MFGRSGYTMCRHGEPEIKDGKTFCAPKRKYSRPITTTGNSPLSYHYCQGCRTFTWHYNTSCRYCPRDV